MYIKCFEMKPYISNLFLQHSFLIDFVSQKENCLLIDVISLRIQIYPIDFNSYNVKR